MANSKGNSKLTLILPSMVRVAEFIPTSLMLQTLSVYLLSMDKELNLSGYQASIEAGCSPKIWFRWVRERKGFVEWWNQSVAEYHKSTRLSDIYGDIYKFARKGANHADRKLYLERFDKDYKPQHKEEHSFPGIMPPEEVETLAARSRVREEEMLAKEIESKVVEGSSDPPPPPSQA